MVIAPGAMLGLLGGGQLGRMFTMAAQSMGYRVTVLDPGSQGPAASVADDHVCADYLDQDGLECLAQACAAATTEFENVPADSLRYLSRRCVVSPAADSVAVAQDRIHEKQFLGGSGFDVAPFAVIRTRADLDAVDAALLPGILKVSRFGYDGKGQARVASRDQLQRAWLAMGQEPCVLEQRLALAAEVSVVVARCFDGQVATFPVAENRHRHGILDISIAPARVSSRLAACAREAAIAVAQKLDYRGVLCVEFFVLEGGRLLINEIAPRPHNSGHYSIDACVTSQFEQQVRVLCGLPLGDTAMHAPAVMVNLLGDLWRLGVSPGDCPRSPDWSGTVLSHPRAKLHLYGKREPRPGRKMGHFTVLGESVEQALAVAQAIRGQLERAAAPQPAEPERAQ